MMHNNLLEIEIEQALKAWQNTGYNINTKKYSLQFFLNNSCIEYYLPEHTEFYDEHTGLIFKTLQPINLNHFSEESIDNHSNNEVEVDVENLEPTIFEVSKEIHGSEIQILFEDHEFEDIIISLKNQNIKCYFDINSKIFMNDDFWIISRDALTNKNKLLLFLSKREKVIFTLRNKNNIKTGYIFFKNKHKYIDEIKCIIK